VAGASRASFEDVTDTEDRRVRTVIVDDEAEVRDLLRLRLERHGSFEVVGEGADGPDAVELCEREQPDVVVLDARMPSGDGTTVVPEIRHLAPKTTVIIYTGDTSLRTRDESERVGAHAVVGKLDPFEWLVGTIFRLRPEFAPPAPPPDDFGDRMGALLLEDDARRGERRHWWRSSGHTRWGRIILVVLLVLPLVAGAAWVVAVLIGSLGG
jgi:CheY-like chemotaxis protein